MNSNIEQLESDFEVVDLNNLLQEIIKLEDNMPSFGPEMKCWEQELEEKHNLYNKIIGYKAF